MKKYINKLYELIFGAVWGTGVIFSIYIVVDWILNMPLFQ